MTALPLRVVDWCLEKKLEMAMNAQQQSDVYRGKALHFFERARSYEEIGLVRIAEELKDAARAFQDAADYLSQPWVRDLPWEEATTRFSHAAEPEGTRSA